MEYKIIFIKIKMLNFAKYETKKTLTHKKKYL